MVELETPPLTRERLDPVDAHPLRRRNTPAYAGKTESPRRLELAPGKHPRLRGEDPPQLFPEPPDQETPPLTRGRPARQSLRDGGSGNTPAYAGKTPASAEGCKLFRGVTKVGNTPAYAGKTSQLCKSCACWRKHPRLRGEDLILTEERVKPAETPPLTRGRPSRG